MANTKKILIVEDEKSLLKGLTIKFSKEGFSVFGAQDGKAGLRLALSKKPDLILLDIVMPVMDGITMLKELRKDKWGKSAIVFLLTNLEDADKTTQSIEQNAAAYLVKSNWTLNDLVQQIKLKLADKGVYKNIIR